MSNNKTRRKFSEEEKKEFARTYLALGTFRMVAEELNVSKSAVHCAVRKFIEKGEFEEVEDLKFLIEENKRERYRRGGLSLQRKKRTKQY